MFRKAYPIVFTALALLSCSSETTPIQPATGTCQPGAAVCGTACVNLASDPNNCGQCGAMCGAGLVCSAGVCSGNCAANLVACNAACVDLQTDFTNCGQCGVSCGTGSCIAGACVANIGSGGSSSSGAGGAGTASGGSGVGGAATSTSLTPATTWSTCDFTDAEIQAAYTSWSNTYIATCSVGKRVVGCASSTCSEALGYGMLIAANSGHKDLFDGIWAFVDSLIPVPSAGGTVAGNNLVPWSINSSCVPDDYNNATDADLDIAMALVQAEKVWPGNGYLDGAIPIIKDILNKNTALSNGKRVLLTGAKQTVANGGRPSYFAPGYYRVFIDVFQRAAYADATQVTGWTELLSATYEQLSASQNGMANALWPDWWPLDGTTSSGQAFGWDACRAPWRIATDFAWFASADASAALLKARAVQANPYVAAPTKNSAQVGALAFTSMPAGQAAFQTACDQWTSGALSDGVYFQDSLKLLYMQLAGGFFPSTLE